MKTQAWVLVEINKLELMDIELPPLQEGQALVEIHYTSVCGSQLNEIYGRKGADNYLPHLLGHEAVSKIIEVKDETGFFKNNDRVVCTWIRDGQSNYKSPPPKGITVLGSSKSINAGPITTFNKHAIISLDKLIKLNETEIRPEHALLGCAIPTGAGSLRYCSHENICIVGLGGVGMAAALEAKHRGLNIFGVDTNEFKRSFAASQGVFSSADISSVLSPRFILESSGNKRAMEASFSALATNGTLVLAGNLPKGQKIEIDPFKFIMGCRVRGVVGGDCSHTDILEFAGRTEIFKQLISRHYSFEQLDKAIADLAEGRIIKPIIECQI